MAADIWRDTANNKVYVKSGSETIEVPHIIAEAYRQDEARLLKELREEHVLAETLGRCYEDSKAENAKLRKQYEAVIADYRSEVAKLRELVDYMTPIAWYAASEQERDRMYELGIEVGE